MDTNYGPQLVPRKRPAHNAGFTLIELIAVVVIIGIIISFATLSIGQHSDQRLQTEAKRLQHLLRMASDEAIMQTREYAIRFSGEGYSFLVMGADGKFLPIEADPLFAPRKVDDDTKLSLTIDDHLIEFNPELEPPSIYILSSGEVTPPFKVSLSDRQELLGGFDIVVDFTGATELSNSDKDSPK